MGRRETMQNLIFKIFKEIGREKTMAYIKQDFKDGRRASVRVVDQKALYELSKPLEEDEESEELSDQESNQGPDPKESFSGLISSFSWHKKVNKPTKESNTLQVNSQNQQPITIN